MGARGGELRRAAHSRCGSFFPRFGVALLSRTEFAARRNSPPLNSISAVSLLPATHYSLFTTQPLRQLLSALWRGTFCRARNSQRGNSPPLTSIPRIAHSSLLIHLARQPNQTKIISHGAKSSHFSFFILHYLLPTTQFTGQWLVGSG
jgi:hypothetical protein